MKFNFFDDEQNTLFQLRMNAYLGKKLERIKAETRDRMGDLNTKGWANSSMSINLIVRDQIQSSEARSEAVREAAFGILSEIEKTPTDDVIKEIGDAIESSMRQHMELSKQNAAKVSAAMGGTGKNIVHSMVQPFEDAIFRESTTRVRHDAEELRFKIKRTRRNRWQVRRETIAMCIVTGIATWIVSRATLSVDSYIHQGEATTKNSAGSLSTP